MQYISKSPDDLSHFPFLHPMHSTRSRHKMLLLGWSCMCLLGCCRPSAMLISCWMLHAAGYRRNRVPPGPGLRGWRRVPAGCRYRLGIEIDGTESSLPMFWRLEEVAQPDGDGRG
jgi:hypothetical protein